MSWWHGHGLLDTSAGSCTGSPLKGGQKSSDTMVALYRASAGFAVWMLALMRFELATSCSRAHSQPVGHSTVVSP